MINASCLFTDTLNLLTQKQTAMKLKLIITIALLLLSFNLLYSQSWQYAHAFGGSRGSGITPNNNVNNLITDDYGNAYVFGTYGTFATIGDSTLPSYSQDKGSFIVKYNCAGGVEWHKAISNAQEYDDQGSHLILKDNHLYLMGSTRFDSYYNTWFLDTLIYGALLTPPYTYPYLPNTRYTYIIKMDARNGSILDYHLLNDWLTPRYEFQFAFWDDLWSNPNHKRGFAIDNEGDYYIPACLSTAFYHQIYCDNVSIIDSVELNYIGDHSHVIPCILKFDSNFNFLWYKPFFSHASDSLCGAIPCDITDMYCAEDNHIYMTGYAWCGQRAFSYDYSEEISIPFPMSIYFRSGDSIRLELANSRVGYLLKMDREGGVLWCRQSQNFCNLLEANGHSNFEKIYLHERTNDIYVSGYA